MKSIISFNGAILSGVSIHSEFLISIAGGGKKFGIPNKLYLINKENKILDELDTDDKMVGSLSKSKINLILGVYKNFIIPYYLDIDLKIKKLDEIKICEEIENISFKGKISNDNLFYSIFNKLNNTLYVYSINFNIKKIKVNLKLKKEIKFDSKIMDIIYNENLLLVILKNKLFVFDLKKMKSIYNFDDENLISGRFYENDKLILLSLVENKLIFNLINMNEKILINSKSFIQKNLVSSINYYKNLILLGDQEGIVGIYNIDNLNFNLIKKIKSHEFPINSCGFVEENDNFYFTTSSDRKLIIRELKLNIKNYNFVIISIVTFLILLISYLIKVFN